MNKRRESRNLMQSIISGVVVKEARSGDEKIDAPATRPSRISPLGLMSETLSDYGKAATSVSADQIKSIDPRNCVSSIIRDRLQLDNDEDLEQLKASIKEDGQQVPVLVRPVLGENNRYQIAFGHRRWKACLDMDVMLKAVVQDLSDEQLVIAQGQENHERKNLSFIETALFATKLSEAYPKSVVVRAIGAKSAGA